MTKQTLLKFAAGATLLGTMLMPTVGMAATTTSAQIQSLTSLIQQMQALQAQVNALKAQQTALGGQVATEFNAFVTNLCAGSQGDAVTALQALLAANENIYPEGQITGYFGKATERALKRFQRDNNLEQVGCVGPKTRALLNGFLKEHPVGFENDNEHASSTNRGKRVCARIAPGHLIAKGWLKKNDGVRPIVAECQTLPPGIERKLHATSTPPGSTTTPDITGPVIINLATLSATSTQATSTWSTNENATSTLWYGTTSPVSASNSTRLDNTTFQTAHSYGLVGLTPSTTYYFMVRVSDIFNNLTVSSQSSFTTGVP